MGFADFARDSSKRNRELRAKKEPFQRMKENYFITPQPVSFKEGCPQKIEEIKQRHLKLKKRERILGFIILVLSALLVGWFFWKILWLPF